MQKTLLIYRLGSLGDTIVALPVFHAIARKFPGHRRIVLTNFPVSNKAAPLESILGDSGLIHGTISYPMCTRSPKILWNLIRSIRAQHVDTMIFMSARGLMCCYRDLIFFRLCGIRHIIGAPTSRDLQENRAFPDGTVERECARLARTMSALGPIDLEDPRNWDLLLSDAEKAAGQKACAPLAGKPYIAINMGGKDPSKDWGVANWTTLIRAISRAHPDTGLLVVGAPVDYERVAGVTKGWTGPIANACGQLSPRESGAALSGAQLFIGHDSGPMHLAAAMDVPCIGLFGSLNQPCKWHPPGPKHSIIHHTEGVATITTDEVIDLVLKKMAA